MEKLTREQYRERVAAKVAAAQEVLAAEVGSLVRGTGASSSTSRPSCTTTAPTTSC